MSKLIVSGGKLPVAERVLRVSVWANVCLAALKFAAGIIAGSQALISDGIDSLSDVFATVIVIIGVRMSGKSADKDHPYGHERFEPVAALALAAVLFIAAAGIGWTGIQKIISGDYGSTDISAIALVASLIAIAVKECMYRYVNAAAKKINSGALRADAWHHRTDALSSVGSFIGVLGAKLGAPIFDPLAGAVIALFVFKAAFDIAKDAVSKLTDRACDDTLTEEIRSVVLKQENVRGVDALFTRLFGNRVYVDIEISVNGETPLKFAHAIAQQVHDEVETRFPQIKHCMVHVNPDEPSTD
jgi:cation diffusion facilitator family transporter